MNEKVVEIERGVEELRVTQKSTGAKTFSWLS